MKTGNSISIKAVLHTFQTRNTGFEENHPLFSDAFVNDKNRLFQWKHFLKKINAPDLDFPQVIKSITERMYPIYKSLNT